MAEQDRPDVAAARKASRKEQKALDPKQLVFLDETAATTKMTRLYGRVSQGKRLAIRPLENNDFHMRAAL